MAYDPLSPVIEKENYEEWTDAKLATERDRRGAFKYSWLPKPSGKKKLYTIGLSGDCPRKNITMFGITFEKEIFKPITEPGQIPEPVQAVVELADNQVEAIRKRAEVLELEYLDVVQEPHPLNPAFTVTVAGDYKRFKVSDYLIIQELPIKKWDKNIISMYELQSMMSQQLELATSKKEK